MADKWIEEVNAHFRGSGPLAGYRHVHNGCCEIQWVLQGEGNVLLGDRIYPLKPNHIYFIPSLVLHCMHPVNLEAFVRSNLIFSRNCVKKALEVCGKEHLLEKLEQTPWMVDCSDPQKIARIEHYFQEAVQIRQQDYTSDIQSEGVLLQMIAYFFEQIVPDTRSVASTESVINTVLTYINTHLTEDLSLDRIAEHCHISKYHMCRQFHKEVNMTVMQYISNQRTVAAKGMLIETEKPVSTIALENGYATTSHFCSVFRRMEGLSPAAFRKKYKQK